MVLISISGNGGSGVMRVDGERWRVFQGLAMLLMGSMSRSNSQERSSRWGVGVMMGMQDVVRRYRSW